MAQGLPHPPADRLPGIGVLVGLDDIGKNAVGLRIILPVEIGLAHQQIDLIHVDVFVHPLDEHGVLGNSLGAFFNGPVPFGGLRLRLHLGRIHIDRKHLRVIVHSCLGQRLRTLLEALATVEKDIETCVDGMMELVGKSILVGGAGCHQQNTDSGYKPYNSSCSIHQNRNIMNNEFPYWVEKTNFDEKYYGKRPLFFFEGGNHIVQLAYPFLCHNATQ